MFTVLLLAEQILREEERQSLYRVVEELPEESLASPYLLRRWLKMSLRGLRRAHADLWPHHDLSAIPTGHGLLEELNEVCLYVSMFRQIGHPALKKTGHFVDLFAHRTHRFLLGTPAQDRGP
jgi:hypothetical protein